MGRLMAIYYLENTLTVQQCVEMRQSVGWTGNVQQIQKSLENGLYSLAATDGQCIVGMGRLVGDGAMYWYIQDLIVKPAYQERGIGASLLKRLISYAVRTSLPETTISIGLMSVKGREPFYEKYGFIDRPNETLGAGMVLYKTT